MRKLERKWSRELVVIGVHSPKFLNERDTVSLRHAILRHGVGHPVVNDRDFRVFRAYAARAWPTLVFLDPRGKVLGHHEGEAPFDALDRVIADMVREFDARGLLDRTPLASAPERVTGEPSLRFPGKVLAHPETGRLVIADSGHHRIVVADLEGRVTAAIGSGAAGFDDGPADRATFSAPQGVALHGDRLYVADTENHAIRLVDLAAGTVTTVAGTGEQLTGPRVGGRARDTRLASPWDLTILDGTLHVAMAGTHQLWAMPLGGETIAPHTGDGREALVDGVRGAAAMNQPSGLTHDGRRLYVADSEASAIRVVDLAPAGEIRTIVGEGLFEFGDRDGVGPAAVRLQHPLGLAWHDGALWIADTYNHKIKRLDPATASCVTVLGTGGPGADDGPGAAASFSEPSGVSVAGGRLYVADTNNHAVRVADPERATVATLGLVGLEPPRRGD
ncbi:MAG: alkyl hydroperoxide reductase [Candidatus Rokubacteria bacterium]|nr:alkyl hydroperoxide reductase [Candidatus Rokubacteria bacterium]